MSLTAEEWRFRRTYKRDPFEAWLAHDGSQVVVRYRGDHVAAIGDSDRLALAALCVDGTPGGFTRADVRSLREHGMDDLADRVEALVPPEKEWTP